MQIVEKTAEADIESQLGHVIDLAKEFGATRLILFGSAADNLSSARDIDLACDGVTGWAFYELGALLEEALQKPLDLVPLTPSNRFTQFIEQGGKVLI
jgi:predicted nucleotidyltransferase